MGARKDREQQMVELEMELDNVDDPNARKDEPQTAAEEEPGLTTMEAFLLAMDESELGALSPKTLQMSLHLEPRLMLYLEALVRTGTAKSKNDRVRALIAADYAWGRDSEWLSMVKAGLMEYERKFGGKADGT